MKDYIRIIKLPFRRARRIFNIFLLDYRVKQIKKRIYQKLKRKEKIKVAFLVQYPEMWNSLKTVFEAMAGDESFSVSIFTFPKKIGVNLNEPQFFDRDEAGEFFASNFIDYTSAYNRGEWIDFLEISPDIIFVQRTYDEYLPEAFSLHMLSGVALLAYIPYSYQFGPGIHLQTEYNNNALNNLYFIFPESEDSYNYIVKKSILELKIGCRKICYLGFPRFDILDKKICDREKNISTFLWLPRWSDDALYDKGHFMRYYKDIVTYFEKNKNLSLIIRPHPLMFNNYIDKKIMTEEDVNSLKLKIANITNINFDENFDYIETFKVSDALIADFSGLLAEFFITGKPIIYCGDKHSFTSDISKKIYNTFYVSETIEQLLENISVLSKGTISDFEKKKGEIISEMLNGEGISANRIVSSIKEVITDDYSSNNIFYK